jgi:hypothetical protein
VRGPLSEEDDNRAVRLMRWSTEAARWARGLQWLSLSILSPFCFFALSDEGPKILFGSDWPHLSLWRTSWLSALAICIIVSMAAGLVAINGRTKADLRTDEEMARLREKASAATVAMNDAVARQDAREAAILSILQDVTTVVNGYLLGLANGVLEMSDDDRVSLYIHDGQRFVAIGRYSASPAHIKKGRTFLPENEGCLGKAWLDGQCCSPRLPEPGTSRYSTSQTELGLPLRTVDTLSMKPRFIYAHRICSMYSASKEPVGVLVIESTKRARFTQQALRSALRDQDSYLGTLIAVVRPHAPSVELMEGLLHG